MDLINSLKKHAPDAAPIYPGMNASNTIPVDFSINNPLLKKIDLLNTMAFNNYIEGVLARSGALYGIGGYMEHREIYKRSALFNVKEESRCIHLGIDIWTKAGTPFCSPFNGKIHSFKNNDAFGDYGPTLIVEYELDNIIFFILYGHLDPEVLHKYKKGQPIKAADELGLTGNFPENGNWPPHLHMQIIRDLCDYEGDFPGVCNLSERAYYFANCPDPAALFHSNQNITNGLS